MRAASSAATAILMSRVAPTAAAVSSINWGVYGVPETYVIDRSGHITYKLVGPISAANLQGALMPAVENALAKK